MDFKQLEAYVLTIQLNSFSKAADSMDISQSSVSLYVRALEKELKTKLIIRTTRNIILTPNGEMFYEYAKNILSIKDEAIFSVKKDSESFQGNIKILASSVPAQYVLPELISKFNQNYNNISFNVVQSNSSDVIEAVANNECEFGMVGSKIENQKCYYKHILSSPLVLITPPSKKNEINIENISKYIYEHNFIAREEGSATKSSYEKYMKQLGIKVNDIKPIAKFSSTHSVIEAVANGLGCSIVAEIAVRNYIKSGLVNTILLSEINKIKKDTPVMSFYFVFRRENIMHPRLKLFVDFILTK